MVRSIGVQIGFEFPEDPPLLSLFGPDKNADYLTPSNPTFKNLELQELLDPLTDVDVDDVAGGLIKSNHKINVEVVKKFHEKMTKILTALYFGAKDAVLKMDSLNQLYMSMYAHVDGCLRELAKAESVKVFKPEVRKEVTKDKEDNPPSGVLGGDASLAEKLTEANKTEEIIQKVSLTCNDMII